MLHKYYAKVMKNVKLPEETHKENPAPMLIKLALLPRNEKISARPYSNSSPRNMRLYRNSPKNRSPLNFSACLKRSYDENVVNAQQKQLEEISIGLFSIYESLYQNLYTDEVFFFY